MRNACTCIETPPEHTARATGRLVLLRMRVAVMPAWLLRKHVNNMPVAGVVQQIRQDFISNQERLP